MNRGTTRRYSHNRLVSWSIIRCKLCGKFISATKGQGHRVYCKMCSIKLHIEYNRVYKKLHKDQLLAYAREYSREYKKRKCVQRKK